MSLDDKVRKWIEDTGFPLEMEAATCFREAGFDVRQASVVLDTQEGKSREVDVLAEDPDIWGIVEISCVVECKSSKAHPWVVFTADDVLSSYIRLHAFCLSSPQAKEAVLKAWGNEELKNLLHRSSRCGYAFKQALGKDDHAYSASIGVLKACNVIAANVRETQSLPHLKFVFPIIVVDSPLFECSLSESGELTVNEVAVSQFLYSAYVPEFAGCCIKVVTKDALPAVALEYRETAKVLRMLFDDPSTAIENMK